VLVLDISLASSSCASYHLTDSHDLSAFLATEISDQVAVRLFLVEDITSTVIEILGSAMSSNPELFLSHMYHYGMKFLKCLDLGGSRGSSFFGRPESISVKRQKDYFSFPLRRKFIYSDRKAQVEHEKIRSMFRGYNHEEETIEERISGTFYATEGSKRTTGMSVYSHIFPVGFNY
jgi:hypothetical protein